jgi:hypothetical protein
VLTFAVSVAGPLPWSPPAEGEVLAHCGLLCTSLITSDVEHFVVYLSHILTFFFEHLFKVICHF